MFWEGHKKFEEISQLLLKLTLNCCSNLICQTGNKSEWLNWFLNEKTDFENQILQIFAIVSTFSNLDE